MFRNIIGGIVTGSFVGALIALFMLPIPTANEQLITYMLGQLSGFVGGVMAYHYASTATSEQKNKLLVEATATQNQQLLEVIPNLTPPPTPPAPVYTEENPLPTKTVNTSAEPVPVEVENSVPETNSK